MNIQSVNNGDSWERFVRLVADARTRSARATVQQPVTTSRPAAVQPARPAAVAGYGAVRYGSRGAPVQPQAGGQGLKPGSPAKSLGSYFDAYA